MVEQQPYAVQLKQAATLKPYDRNARVHSREQLDQLKALIRLVGFTNPVLADERGIIAGHGRTTAALEMYAAGEVIHGPGKRYKLPPGSVPVIDASGMTEEERRAYILADNAVAINASWDEGVVRSELHSLAALDFNLSLTGFTPSGLAELMNVETPPATVSFTPKPKGKTVTCPKCQAEFKP